MKKERNNYIILVHFSTCGGCRLHCDGRTTRQPRR